MAGRQRARFPAFVVWHRPDLSEFVVTKVEDWAAGGRSVIVLGNRAFAEVIRNLPELQCNPNEDALRDGPPPTERFVHLPSRWHPKAVIDPSELPSSADIHQAHLNGPVDQGSG